MARFLVNRASTALLLGAALVLLCPSWAAAHGGPLNRPVGWVDWNFDPPVMLMLLSLSWIYIRGLRRVGRSAGGRKSFRNLRAGCFALGLMVLLAAVVSPLDALSFQLGAAHMVQHMLIMTVAAPLIMSSAPTRVLSAGLPPGARRACARLLWWLFSATPVRNLLWRPWLLFTLYAAVLWLWHLPALYTAALRSAWVHDLQHMSFFAAACLFWRVLVHPVSRHRAVAPLAVLLLFATTLHSSILGVLMTIAPGPWYADYIGRTALWGVTALEDQQLAGLIMWMPACFAYLVVAVTLLALSLQRIGDGAGASLGGLASSRSLG